MAYTVEWTDKELIEGLVEINLWNDTFITCQLSTTWIVDQLTIRKISDKIEQALIDGMTVCFNDSGELVAVERDNA